jgi:DNA polymerase I
VGALQYFGLSSIAPKHKDAMRERIMRGWPFTTEEMQQILNYCAEDVDALHQLLVKMLPHIDLPLALHRGEAVAALVRSEHIGVPVDMKVFSQLADQKTWRELRDSRRKARSRRVLSVRRDKAISRC